MKKRFLKLTLVLLISILTVMMITACEAVDQIKDQLGFTEEPAHTHEYSEEITKAATCTAAGEKTFTCSCGDSYTEEIEKLPHTEKTLDAVPATCTKTGLTEGKKCTVCGVVTEAQKNTPMTDHAYTKETDRTNATCTEDGSYTMACECGATQTTVLPKGHKYNSTVTAPTCTEDGYTTYTCSVCSDSYVDDKNEASGHTHSTDWSVDETQHWHECHCGDKADVADHTYDNACDADCNECGATRTPADHTYDNNCDADCNECGAIRTPRDHTYDNACDVDCNECGATRTPADHTYDNNCDADCNECGATRTPADHTYDNACDVDCNECGATRTPADHTYDNNCDADCNECGATRTPADHIYDNACDVDCNECGAIRTSADHTYDNNCDVDCNECGATRTPRDHTYDNACDADCNECGATRTPADHIYDNACDADCNECGAIRTPADHIYDNACDADCNECGAIRTSADHTYDNNCDVDCNECGATRTPEDHTYDNACDADCNECGATRTPADHTYDDDCDADCNECGEIRVLEPIVFNEEVVKKYDIFSLENKVSTVLDLSENVNNLGNYELSYSVADTTLDSSLYTFTFGIYNDITTYENIAVTVSYILDGEEKTISYTYKLEIKDTTACRLANGDFESGMEGWTQVGNIGNVSTDTHYWLNDPESAEGYVFGMDGEKMFSAYAPGALESAVGTLTSSTFKIGGSGFVTFKIGAMRDGNYVYIDVVDAETKEILARYYNGLWADRTDDRKSGCTLIAYKADLSAFAGKEVFFRISDNADSGYGLFFADSFITYYENEPEGFNVATPVGYEINGTIYDVFNGGFEMGDVQGWWNNGEPGKVTGADAFFSGVAYGKDGNFLYSGVEDHGAGNGREGNVGVLTSSVFEIGGSGYITYMLGGGNAFCYVQVIDSTTGEILARYRQQARNDAVLVKYVADLSAYIGRTVRVQVVDNATYDWGCVSFDNLVTYYESKPEGLDAVDVKYEIVDGSFESGNKSGWKQNGENLGEVINNEINEGWYTKNDDNKDGAYLFSFAFYNNEGGVVNVEGGKGNIESSNFVLKQGSYVSFRFGGAGGVSNHDVYIQLCRADGSVIATFYNDAEGKVNTRMNSYYYQYQGEEADCFFRVVDNSTGDYGCFVVDDFRVNLENAPDGYIAAIQ